jgi:hypothetical protein
LLLSSFPVTDFESVLATVAVARDFGVTRLLLFGSAMENPENARDLDLACAGVPGWRLFEFAAVLKSTLKVPLM